MRTTVFCLLLAVAAAAIGAAGATAPRTKIMLTLHGVRHAKVGMSPVALAAVWNVPVRMQVSAASGGACGSATVRFRGERVTAWFEHGKLAKIDARGGAVTDRGAATGDRLARLQALYGERLLPHLHPYSVPNYNDFYVRSGNVYLYFGLSPQRTIDSISYGNRFVFAEEGCA